MDPTHGRAKSGRPARRYIQQLCENTGCCPEDLPRVMNVREEWRERVRDIRATSVIWWWWWDVIKYCHVTVMILHKSFVCTSFFFSKYWLKTYLSKPEWTWEQWQWRGTPLSSDLQCWHLYLASLMHRVDH